MSNDDSPEVVYQLWCADPHIPEYDERQYGEFPNREDAEHVISQVTGPDEPRSESDFDIRLVEQ